MISEHSGNGDDETVSVQCSEVPSTVRVQNVGTDNSARAEPHASLTGLREHLQKIGNTER